jgi:hypothetical protein
MKRTLRDRSSKAFRWNSEREHEPSFFATSAKENGITLAAADQNGCVRISKGG